jgi:hypothetical protein
MPLAPQPFLRVVKKTQVTGQMHELTCGPSMAVVIIAVLICITTLLRGYDLSEAIQLAGTLLGWLHF